MGAVDVEFELQVAVERFVVDLELDGAVVLYPRRDVTAGEVAGTELAVSCEFPSGFAAERLLGRVL